MDFQKKFLAIKDGQCEYFNSTLISRIGTLPIEAKIKWQEQLPALVHAYNCSHSNVTGFRPFYLIYRRQCMLPVDVQFGVRRPDIVATTSSGYIQTLQKRLGGAYKTAQEIRKKESDHSKRRHSWNVKCTKLESGDLVLVRQRLSKESIKLVIDGKYPISGNSTYG